MKVMQKLVFKKGARPIRGELLVKFVPYDHYPLSGEIITTSILEDGTSETIISIKHKEAGFLDEKN